MIRARPRTDAAIDLASWWRNAEYCVIDVETTGLDLRRDEIVSVGSARTRDGRIICADNYYSLVRPSREISVASIRIHGLRTADLKRAPSSVDVSRQIANRLAGRIMVAHAAWVERAFLGRMLGNIGIKLAEPQVDTAALARALGLADATIRREPSLELLARQLCLPAYSPHNALGDAFTTAAVFLAMATQANLRVSGNRPMPLRSLLEMAARHAR
jgi:DNA polymerase III subunit epsilon